MHKSVHEFVSQGKVAFGGILDEEKLISLSTRHYLKRGTRFLSIYVGIGLAFGVVLGLIQNIPVGEWRYWEGFLFSLGLGVVIGLGSGFLAPRPDPNLLLIQTKKQETYGLPDELWAFRIYLLNGYYGKFKDPNDNQWWHNLTVDDMRRNFGQPSVGYKHYLGFNLGKESFRKIQEAWLAYQMDILQILNYPSLLDPREESTREFTRAFAYAQNTYPDIREPYRTDHPFHAAVVEAQISWEFVQNESNRIRRSRFSDGERRRLQRAFDLLSIAYNDSSSVAERQAAYERAIKQLDGLIVVPTKTIRALEEAIQYRELES